MLLFIHVQLPCTCALMEEYMFSIVIEPFYHIVLLCTQIAVVMCVLINKQTRQSL